MSKPRFDVLSDDQVTLRRERALRYRSALEAMLEGGLSFAEIDIRELATDSDSSKSSFYTYFENKVDFICALSEIVVTNALDAMRRAWTPPPPEDKDQLTERVRGMLEDYRREARLGRVLVEVAAYDDRARELLDTVVESSREGLQHYIEEGQRIGTLRAEVDAPVVAGWFIAMLVRGSHELIGSAKPARLNRLVVALTDILWNTLHVRGR